MRRGMPMAPTSGVPLVTSPSDRPIGIEVDEDASFVSHDEPGGIPESKHGNEEPLRSAGNTRGSQRPSSASMGTPQRPRSGGSSSQRRPASTGSRPASTGSRTPPLGSSHRPASTGSRTPPLGSRTPPLGSSLDARQTRTPATTATEGLGPSDPSVVTRTEKTTRGSYTQPSLQAVPTRTLAANAGNTAVSRTTFASLPNTFSLLALGAAGHAMAFRVVADTEFARDAIGARPAWWAWFCGLASLAVVVLSFLAKLLFLNGLDWVPRFLVREWRHPVRACYFFGPHLAAVALAVSTPPTLRDRFRLARSLVLDIGLGLQFALSAGLYSRWVGERSKKPVALQSRAGPSHALPLIGWPLLALLASNLDLDRRWGFQVVSLILGPSVVLFPAVVAGLAVAANDDHRAAAAHLLLAAPPAVAALLFLDLGQHQIAAGLIAFALLAVLAFVRPAFRELRATIGVAWASVFPTAVLGAALVRFAQDQQGPTVLKALAFAVLALAALFLAVLLLKLLLHLFYFALGAVAWQDPLKHNPKHAHMLRSWAGIWIYMHIPEVEKQKAAPPQADSDDPGEGIECGITYESEAGDSIFGETGVGGHL